MLRERYPQLRVESDRVEIGERDIMIAGGVLAWIDMGLTLVERLLGHTVMTTTARFMLVEVTGLTPRDYCKRLRIERSRELFTRDTVDQVALASGYKDPRCFRRTLKRVTGLSRAEYRRKFQRPGPLADSLTAA